MSDLGPGVGTGAQLVLVRPGRPDRGVWGERVGGHDKQWTDVTQSWVAVPSSLSFEEVRVCVLLLFVTARALSTL